MSSPYHQKLLNPKLKDLYDQSNIVFFIWRNADGWPLEYVSSNVEKVLGYKAEEFYQNDLQYSSLIHPEDLPHVFEEVSKNTDSGVMSFSHEDYRLQKKSGEFIWVTDSTIMDRDEEGGVKFYIGHIYDTSDHHRMLQAVKLATIGEVSAEISHEIKNPLSIALSYLDMLLRDDTVESLGKKIEFVEKAKKSLKRIEKTINGTLHFSRNSSELTRNSASLRELVNEAIEMLRDRARHMDVKLSIEEFEDVMLCCDDVLIGQVLINLVNNGMHEAEKQDDKWVCIHAKHDTEWVTITVEDSGPGIDQELVEKIFDSFYTTKKAGEGTGLGLSMSRKFVESHGGTLKVCDKGGPHTKFEIILPLNQSAAPK